MSEQEEFRTMKEIFLKYLKEGKFQIKPEDCDHLYREINDGWFTYYYNIKSGKMKFKLERGDILLVN